MTQEEEARGVFQQLLLALDYCHGLGVANRDIKLDNVLLTSSKKPAVIKLTDFGFCKQDKSIASSLVGTAMYMGMQPFNSQIANLRIPRVTTRPEQHEVLSQAFLHKLIC